MKQILCTRQLVETFIKEGMSTKKERDVLLLRVQWYTIAEQAEMLNISNSKVNRITNGLKIKYDALQGTINELPKRTETTKELYREA